MTSARPKSPLSVVICAFNGLGYTKLLVESLRRHSVFDNEIVVWSDGSTDGTEAWLGDQPDLLWKHDPVNRGICTAMNNAAKFATRGYLFFPNTDHVLAPGWDEALLRRLGPRTVVSLACIEPGIVPVAPIFHAVNLGTRHEEFDWAGFEAAAGKLSREATVPGVNYPFALARTLWQEVGELDERFNPGPANDPDLFYRLSFADAEMLRAEDCLAYHFSGKSSRMADEATRERREWREVTDRNEARFEEKWGERYRYANGGLPDPGSEARKKWFAGTARPPAAEGEKRLRVLLDARAVQDATDGIGAYVAGLVRGLSRLSNAVDLHVLSNDPKVLVRKIGPLRGIKCRIVTCRPGDVAGEAREIRAAVDQIQPDVYHGPAFTLPRGLSCPGVVTAHDVAFDIHPEWYPSRFVEHLRGELRQALSTASGIIAVSECTRRDLGERFSVAADRVSCVPEAPGEGTSPRRSGALAELSKGTFHGGAPYVLAIGMKQRRKNALGLLRSFARAVEAGAGKGVGLLMTMAANSEDPRLDEELRRLPQGSDVFLAGHISDYDLSRALAGASALAYPSLYEGFGLPVLEAMLAGVPVVCSDGGALSEIASDAALMVPAGDEDGLSAALEKILVEKDLRLDLCRRGLSRALEFSWDLTARATLEVYRSALANPLIARETAEVRPPIRPASSPEQRGESTNRKTLRVAVDARMAVAPHTGTGRYTIEILRRLGGVADGAEFVLVGPKTAEEMELPKELRVVNHVLAGAETLLNPAWEQFSAVAAYAGCDVIFSPTGILPVTRGCPGVAVLHDLAFLDHPEDFDVRLREHLTRWTALTCRSAERMIAVSEFTKGRLVDRYQVSPEAIRVVHHGGPHKSTKRTKPRGSAPNILCVSSFEPNKNQGVLLEAFAKSKPGKQARLVLAGRPGRTLVALKQRAKDLGLSSVVRFEEGVSDARIAELFREATAFAFPSRYEGFGLPLVEAMSAELPILCSRIPACEEVLGGAGLLVHQEDVAGWSEGLRVISEDSAACRDLAEKGTARAKAFDWENAAKATWSVIVEAAKTR
ncbi:MAG: glycosyltransferase [Planctomycetes bacterium]|nr:glycosyltransferase [Planctomycetota bacterium]